MKPRVYVTRILPEKAWEMTEEFCEAEVWEGELPPPREVLFEKVREIEGLLCLLTDEIDAPLMDAAPRLKVISNCAVGYDNIDVKAATERGIIVGNTPGVLTDTTADLAFALLMATTRRIPEATRFVRAGKWKTWELTVLLGQDIYGATLGIVGMGRIGSAVVKRAAGFGMKIFYYDVARREDLEEKLGVTFTDLERLLRESDFVTLHVPLTKETHHLIGGKELKMMRPTAILINTSRGPIVDQGALYDALKSGQIAAAGLDVTDPEPISPDDPLLSLDNCVVLPHIGSASIATRTKMATMAAENLIAGLKGEMPPNPVNPEVLSSRVD
ncbi:MAG: glyoxylate reductase [Anaerolineae bacterium]